MDKTGEASLSFEAVGAAAGSSMAEFVPRGVMYYYDGEGEQNVARGEGCFYSAGSGSAVQSQCDMNSYGRPGQIPAQCAVEYASCGEDSADFALTKLGSDAAFAVVCSDQRLEQNLRQRFHIDSEQKSSLHRKYVRGAIKRYANAVGRVQWVGREDRGMGGDVAGMNTVVTADGNPVYLMAGQYQDVVSELGGVPCDKPSCKNVDEALRQLDESQKARLRNYLSDRTKKGREEARAALGPGDRNLGALMNIFEFEASG